MKPIYIAWKSQHNSSWSLVSANYTNQTKQGSIDSYSTRHFNKQNGQPRSQINSQQDNRWASNGSGWSNRFNCPYQPRCQICNQLGHITKKSLGFLIQLLHITLQLILQICLHTQGMMIKWWFRFRNFWFSPTIF
jgi:hypothetical protein